MEVGPYTREPVAFRPWPEGAALVVEALRQQVRRCRPGQVVEHIGSTAVPGLPGKGVVDVMLPVAPAEIPAVADVLAGLGFQRSPGFPTTRPLLLGTVRLGDERSAVHVHVIPADTDEVAAQRGLVQALRAHPELRDAYGELKREIVAAGVTDPAAYSVKKIRWVLTTLERLGLPTLPDPGAPSTAAGRPAAACDAHGRESD